ncbi:hypothetical protein ACRAWF_42690 [Streptomyces sp. L7]
MLIIVAAVGQEQELVLVYAVAVFVSFLIGLMATARFARRENQTALDVDQRPGCRCRRLHPRGEPAARMADAVPGGHPSHRGWLVRAVDVGRTPHRHRRRRGTRRGAE